MKNIDLPALFDSLENENPTNVVDTLVDNKSTDIVMDNNDNTDEKKEFHPIVDIFANNTNNISEETNRLVGPENDPIQETIRAYQTFDSNAWNKKSGFKLPHYPFIQKKLEGLDEGLYLFAAESNAGKTSLMSNILFDACTCTDNHLLGLYFSLDDSKQLVIPRIISMNQNIPISVGAKPHMYKELYENTSDEDPNKELYKSYLDKREKGLQQLIDCANMFQVRDNSDKISNAEEIYNCIKTMVTYVKGMFGEEYNVIVAIDALDDIRFMNEKFSSDTDRHKMIAKTVKDWATEFHIPVFGSRHLNKLRMDRRPTLDDLKDTSEYVYEATVVWLLYNEVGKKKQSASIFYTSPSQANLSEAEKEKQPVIEIDWAKNKASSYKGKSYCYFVPEFSKMIEVSEADKKRFDMLSY